jgi:mannosylglycerate hydrolase
MMLVEVIDKVIDIMEQDEEFKYYTLDGQSIVLDDYLEVKPHMRERLAKLIKAGRIKVGPWYSLVDAYSAVPEGVIRNLLIGDRLCNQFGEPMKFGYSIFSFGQAAQLPQIYAGFGIDNIIFYKGYSSELFKKPEFIWKAPDGTKALTSKLSAFHRVNFFVHFTVPVILGGNMLLPGWKVSFDNNNKVNHPIDAQFYTQHAKELEPDIRIRNDKIRKAIDDLMEEVSVSKAEKTFLGFDGIDFSSPLAEIPESLKMANEVAGDEVEFVHSHINAYIEELREELDLSSLKEYSGELRFGPVWKVHTESMSANVDIKQRLLEAELTLINYAEPFSLFGSLQGDSGQFPSEMLLKAWKYILQCHCHDSVHGLGEPKLKPDSLHRAAQALEIAQSVSTRAIHKLVADIDTSSAGDDDIMITVFNPTAHSRSEVMDLYVDLPREERVHEYWLEELDGTKVEHYQNARYNKNIGSVNAENRPKSVFCDRVELSVDVRDVPAMGYKTMKVKRVKGDPLAPEMPFPPPRYPYNPIGKSVDVLDNGLVRVVIDPNGSVAVEDIDSEYFATGLNTFVDSGCAGDTWVHRPPERDKVITSKGCNAVISMVRNSYLEATAMIEVTLDIPVSLTQDRKVRRDETLATKIVTEVTLRRGSRRVDFKTYFENRCKDHMLIASFPTGITTEHSFSECPFEIRKRVIDDATNNGGVRGDELVHHAMRQFVDISDGEDGLALITKGIHEFETLASDEEGTVVNLTLLRAVTQTFPMHEDVFLSYDKEPSQCIGEHCFEYSVLVHRGDYKQGGVIKVSREYNLPMFATEYGKGKKGSEPMEKSFLKVSNTQTIVNCVKQAEDDESFIVRVNNPTDEGIEEVLEFGEDIKAAWLVNFNEERGEQLRPAGNKLAVELGPYKIVTVNLEF